MKKLIILGSFLGFLTSCHAQEPRQKTLKNSDQVHIDTKTPNGNWHVNKKYDQNGNLIQKDSTYTYSWSSSNGNNPQNQAKADSLMRHFQHYIRENFAAMGAANFFEQPKNKIQGDSTNSVPFFSQDQGPHFDQQMGSMQIPMQQIDSLQQQMIKRFFGQGIIPKKENQQNSNKKDLQESLPSGRQI